LLQFKLQQCATFVRGSNRPPNFSIFFIFLIGYLDGLHASRFKLPLKVKLLHNKEDGDGVQLKLITFTGSKLELNSLTQTEVRYGSCTFINCIIEQPLYGGLIDPPISVFSEKEFKWGLLWQVFSISGTETAISDQLMSFRREMNFI